MADITGKITGKVKSYQRGTRKFQITGIRDALYRAYTIVAFREERSLNATLRLAVEEYIQKHYQSTIRGCEEGLSDDEVEVDTFVPSDVHFAAEARRRY